MLKKYDIKPVVSCMRNSPNQYNKKFGEPLIVIKYKKWGDVVCYTRKYKKPKPMTDFVHWLEKTSTNGRFTKRCNGDDKMNEINEEQILVENKTYLYLFDFDYINAGLYISVYHKENREFVIKEHEITNFHTIYKIKNIVDRPLGSIFKKGGVRFMVRNHDKSLWNENIGDFRESTEGHLFDSRTDNKSLAILPRIITELKFAYMKI